MDKDKDKDKGKDSAPYPYDRLGAHYNADVIQGAPFVISPLISGKFKGCAPFYIISQCLVKINFTKGIFPQLKGNLYMYFTKLVPSQGKTNVITTSWFFSEPSGWVLLLALTASETLVAEIFPAECILTDLPAAVKAQRHEEN